MPLIEICASLTFSLISQLKLKHQSGQPFLSLRIYMCVTACLSLTRSHVLQHGDPTSLSSEPLIKHYVYVYFVLSFLFSRSLLSYNNEEAGQKIPPLISSSAHFSPFLLYTQYLITTISIYMDCNFGRYVLHLILSLQVCDCVCVLERFCSHFFGAILLMMGCLVLILQLACSDYSLSFPCDFCNHHYPISLQLQFILLLSLFLCLNCLS